MQKISTKQLALCAILACVSGILTGPFALYFGTWKISFANVFIILSGILCGPLLGGITGFTADFIGFMFAPRGMYNPLVGITVGLIGVIAGVVYHSKNIPQRSLSKTIITVATSQMLCSFVLNSTLMIIFFGATPAIFITRLALNLVMIPINVIVLQMLLSPRLMAKTSFIYK